MVDNKKTINDTTRMKYDDLRAHLQKNNPGVVIASKLMGGKTPIYFELWNSSAYLEQAQNAIQNIFPTNSTIIVCDKSDVVEDL